MFKFTKILFLCCFWLCFAFNLCKRTATAGCSKEVYVEVCYQDTAAPIRRSPPPRIWIGAHGAQCARHMWQRGYLFPCAHASSYYSSFLIVLSSIPIPPPSPTPSLQDNVITSDPPPFLEIDVIHYVYFLLMASWSDCVMIVSIWEFKMCSGQRVH